MGAFGKMLAEKGCDLVTGIAEFPARNGYIYMFRAKGGATIASFKEIPVSPINDTWAYVPGTTAVSITDRTYNDVVLDDAEEVWFDGAVTAITLSAGSGWVYYCD